MADTITEPFLPLNEPTIGPLERARVLATLEAGFVSTAGPVVAEFEAAFALRTGAAHAIAVSSGTAALHLTLVALGVGADDLVATSDLTFIASANAASYTGAELMFVGPSPTTWNLDTELLLLDIERRAAAGQPLPAAIEPVHILGNPVFWEPLDAITERFGIPIIEDATESLGASALIDGRWIQTGRRGRAGCFSFNGNKMITTGGGGMIVTDDDTLAEKLRHLSTQAKLPGAGYKHDEIGYNYRLPALSAALGLAQLEQLDGFLAAKKTIRDWYEVGLNDLPLELIPTPSWSRSAHWLISARLTDATIDRDELVARLNDRGIGARPIWAPMHQQVPYRNRPVLAQLASVELADAGFSLPSSPSLSIEDVRRVTEALRTVLISR